MSILIFLITAKALTAPGGVLKKSRDFYKATTSSTLLEQPVNLISVALVNEVFTLLSFSCKPELKATQ